MRGFALLPGSKPHDFLDVGSEVGRWWFWRESCELWRIEFSGEMWFVEKSALATEN